MRLNKYVRKYKLNRFTIFPCVMVVLLVTRHYYIDSEDIGSNIEYSECSNVSSRDVLEPVDDEFHIPIESIFFIETSWCRGGLNLRQACSIESAARAHSQTQINVFFCAPVTELDFIKVSLRNLLSFDNIKFGRIEIENFAIGTPIASLIKQHFVDREVYSENNLLDVLRYLILYKWGGIFLDTDIIVAKNLKALGVNWAVREVNDAVNTAVLALSKDAVGKKLAKDLLDELRLNYQPGLNKEWGWNGTHLLTQLLAKKWCSPKNKTEWSAVTCKGFNVYDKKMMYPIHLNNFLNKQDILKSKGAYTYHMRNDLTTKLKNIPKKSPYGLMAQKYCPTVYTYFGKNVRA